MARNLKQRLEAVETANQMGVPRAVRVLLGETEDECRTRLNIGLSENVLFIKRVIIDPSNGQTHRSLH